MTITDQSVIGEIVADNYRFASVFKSAGIDFCCAGNRTIQEACTKKNVDSTDLVSKLNSVASTDTTGNIDFQSWPLDLLADYIEKKHHRYVVEKTQEIMPYLNKVCSVHGGHHPELLEIRDHFVASAGELAMHMKKEELILFPFVRKMVKAKQENANIDRPSFGAVENPINMMKDEHTAEGERFKKIETLSNNYTPPAEACNTYRVTFALLNEFEQDLHMHIHLENNILFRKAIELEHSFA